MQAAQTPASKLRFVKPDKESITNTLWQEEEFDQICSRESLTEKAAEIEKTISVKVHERERHDFDPKMCNENRFWNQRPDGIVMTRIIEHSASYSSNSHLTEIRIFWGQGKMRLMSNTKASSRRSKRLPRNRRLNQLILRQGGVID